MLQFHDPYFRVETLRSTLNPQQVIYFALHQDYSEEMVCEEIENGIFPSEEKAGELAVKLLLKGGRGHFGSIEHPQIVMNFGYFPHSMMQQLRTHRVGVSFDVQCLSGDTAVTFLNNQGSKCGTKTMSELYDLWTNGEKAIRARKKKGRKGEPPGHYRRSAKTRIKKMRVRSLDEERNVFVSNHIEDVVFSGLNPVYKVTLADGKTIKCTQNHQIYTPYGWRILAQIGVGQEVMVNGQPLANADKTYQNKDWLKQHFDNGLTPKEVAAIAGCSKEAVKRWAYHHQLSWQKKQWNKGIKYSIDISDEERQRRSAHARRLNENRVPLRDENHPCWKPDKPKSEKVYHWLKRERNRLLNEKGGVCTECGATEKLHIHHILPVKQHPELAYDESNLQLLCPSCHTKNHKHGVTNPFCSHPVKVVAIEYIGVEATYDLVMKSPHHNFVANGIVVHNSFRYSGKRIIDVVEEKRDIESVFYLRPAGHYTDRQGKKYYYSEEQRADDLALVLHCAERYAERIEQGVSEEHARSLIPFDTRQHFVMSCNARSLMHLLDLRWKKDAQIEIYKASEMMFKEFKKWCPAIANWYYESRHTKGAMPSP